MTERLVIFAPNWLGDAVMALPAIAATRATWPDAVIEVAARPAVAPLFALTRGIDRVVTLRPGGGNAALVQKGRYSTALLLTNSFQTARLTRAAGIPQRWGYAGDFRSWLLTRAVPRPSRLHQIDYYRNLVASLGFSGGPDNPQIQVDDARREEGAAILERAGWNRQTPLVALAPGAAFGTAKRWPAASYAALAARLDAGHARAVLIGSPADRAAGDELRAALPGGIAPVDVIGATDIPQLAGVLANCRSLVTNDSGAMHLGAALGLDVVVMFGPTREKETYPRGSGRHAFLKHDVWCRPCMLRECPLTHRCMTGISVDVVHAATMAGR